MRILMLIALTALLAAPAAAQTKYQQWSNPDDASFAARLNKMIDTAEKDRAADPAFLRDLRALAESAGGSKTTASTQPKQLLNDDFADGNFDRDPTWTVSEGRYWVEAGWGLRSSVSPGTAEEQPKKMKGRDKALALLGAVLNQSMGNNGGTAETTTTTPTQAAVIHTRAALSNAFRIEFGLSSWQAQGQLDIGPWQGSDRTSGYRLVYQPGGALSLVRSSGRGTNVIAKSIRAVPLEDKKSHAVIWRRDATGRMDVSIDGEQVLSATDTGFRDAFRGITIGNRGGDYIVKSIAVFDGG